MAESYQVTQVEEKVLLVADVKYERYTRLVYCYLLLRRSMCDNELLFRAIRNAQGRGICPKDVRNAVRTRSFPAYL